MIIIAVDIGTSSAKGGAFESTPSLKQLGSCCKREFESPAVGASPRAWFDAAVEIIRELCSQHASSGGVGSIVLSGMMQNVIVPSWSEEKCILYHDAMFAKEAHALLEDNGMADILRQLTGNYKGPASIAAKLLQLKSSLTSAKAIPVLFGAHSYVAWRLIGCSETGYHCDPTTASTCGLIEKDTNSWLGSDARAQLGLSSYQLPTLLTSADTIIGTLNCPELPSLTGTSIIHGSGDLGSLVAAVDWWGFNSHAYIGTSGWIAHVVPRSLIPSNPNVFTLNHPTDQTKSIHALPTTSAGSNVSKWAEALFGSSAPALLDKAAIKSYGKSNPCLYIPHIRGERAPISLPNARGTFLNLSMETSKEDMALAILTGVAYQFKWLRETSRIHDDVLCLLGGGSRSQIWPQVFADVLNCEIKTLKQRDDVDETVLGAASLALGKNERKAPKEEDDSIWTITSPDVKEVAKHEHYGLLWQKAVECLKDITFDLPANL